MSNSSKRRNMVCFVTLNSICVILFNSIDFSSDQSINIFVSALKELYNIYVQNFSVLFRSMDYMLCETYLKDNNMTMYTF